MRGDEIQEHLESLRREIRSLNESLVDLKKEDVRRVFGDQIRPILMERIEGFCVQLERDGTLSTEVRSSREDSKRLVENAIGIFQRRGQTEALISLSVAEVGLSRHEPSGVLSRRVRFQLDLIQQLRDYFATFEGISYPETHRTGSLIALSPTQDTSTLSPLAAERALSPLANSWRISILMILAKDEESLTGLSRSLGLPKGHLQFHLKNLLDPGYVRYDRKSHLYSITGKGSKALEGMVKLVESLTFA